MSQTKLAQPRTRWTDDFDRPDSPELGNGWADGHDLHPAHFDRVGIHDSAAVITGLTRPGDYEPENLVGHPPANGRMYAGISFAARSCPDWWLPDIEVIRDARVWANPPPSPPYGQSRHVECTPLLYIDVDNPHGGFGCWPAVTFGGIWATVGSPPELFAESEAPVIDLAPFDNTNRSASSWRIKCVEWGGAILIHNDRQVPAVSRGYAPVPIPAALLASRVHGFALDAHMTRPYATMVDAPAALSVTYHGLGHDDFEVSP